MSIFWLDFLLLVLTLKLDDLLNIKVSDFGVSYWSKDKGEIDAPNYYVGGKDMYQQDNNQTIEYSFDLRYWLLGFLFCVGFTELY